MPEIDTLVDERQIDLEDAIAAKKAAVASDGSPARYPLTVAQFVGATGYSESRVRRAIRDCYLDADDSVVRPMVITGGDMPISVREWQIALGPATRRVKAHVMAWEGNNRVLKILDRSGCVHTFKIPALKHEADRQRKEIDRLDCARDDERVTR